MQLFVSKIEFYEKRELCLSQKFAAPTYIDHFSFEYFKTKRIASLKFGSLITNFIYLTLKTIFGKESAYQST